ncbi:ATP-binding protein [Micromonospora sp. AKA38]|uniref:ATP-binding protein n=1 Tax=Micromonospora sp. AKA38 TaxID=2733861 RepID=UPI0022CB91CA|nr:BTAD domain-containing putative transcriptional regulator [Micromonospora sp. AKA38]GHJ15486.1 SARP family transcriptional regulator [Micromonospora sp. AKA38]
MNDSQVRLQNDSSHYRLEVPSDQVDALEFQEAVARGRRHHADARIDEALSEYERAVGLWRGPILALGSEGEAALAARLEATFVDVVEQLAQLKLDRSDAADIVALLADQVAARPLRESLRLVYMRALWQSGRPAEALTVFERGRQVLADELGVDPNAELRDLHTAILRGNSDRPQERSGDSPGGREEPESSGVTAGRKPCLLPHTPHEFTGRTAELQVLRTAATESGTSALTISAIDGMGGVGKTTLAVRLAHEIAEKFPDGQFFVDLLGFTSGKDPLTPGQALAVLLRDAGLPVESLEADTSGRSAQWRSLMAGKQALIVLDNAVDATQVRALLPGTGGTLVIITSRRRLASLEGAVPLSVDTLPVPDAISLFREVSGDNLAQHEETLTDVVRLCGHLPLAIRIAAARFRHRPNWSIEDLARQLSDYRTRARLLTVGDRSVMVALSLSYRHLTGTQQHVFRLLGVHPATEFDCYSVAALAGMSVLQAEASLEALVDDNVVLQPRAGRYQLHDLLRDAAQQLHEQHDDPTDSRRAAERVVDYYILLARTWCRPLATRPFTFAEEQETTGPSLPPHPADASVREALEGELTNFISAIRLALRHGMHRQVWQLTCAVQPLFALRNYEGDALEMIQLAVTSAHAANDRDGHCLALYALALATRERRESGLAEQIFHKAIEAAAHLGKVGWQTYQWADLGSAQLNSGQPRQARESFRTGLRLATGASDRFAIHLLNNNLSVACRELGAYDDALRHLDAAESALTDLPAEATLWLNLNRALTFSQQGDFQAAYERFSWVLRQATEARSYRRISVALAGLSSTSRALGQAEPALDFGRRSLDLAKQFRLREVECLALACIGEALLEMDRRAESVEVFTRVSTLALDYGFTRYVARAHEGFAHERARAGDVTAARHHWRSASQHYPAGFVDADGPRRHLDATDPRAVDCDRCRHAATCVPAMAR